MTIERIGAVEAARRMREEGYRYLDVRSVAEFEAGHPAGAYNVPISEPDASGRMQPNSEFLAVVASAFRKDDPIVVGCRSGHRSLRAARALIDAGFRRIVEQRAGWGGVRDPFGGEVEPGWQGVGLPTAGEALPGRSYQSLRNRRE